MLKGQKKMLGMLALILGGVIILLVILYQINLQNHKDIKSVVALTGEHVKKTNKIDLLPDKRYVLIPDHKISWKIFKRTGGAHEGIVEKANGFLDYSESLITGGEMIFYLDSVTNIDIYDKILNTRFMKDLNSKDFFAIEKYKTAKIIVSSSEVKKDSNGEIILRGQLTIKDITKPIEITLRKTEHDKKINLIGIAHFNRIDYGINKSSSSLLDTFGSVLIDDDVQLSFVLNFE